MDELIERDGSSWGLRQINERKKLVLREKREKKNRFQFSNGMGMY